MISRRIMRALAVIVALAALGGFAASAKAEQVIFLCSTEFPNPLFTITGYGGVELDRCSLLVGSGESLEGVAGSPPTMRRFQVIKKVDGASVAWRRALLQQTLTDAPMTIHYFSVVDTGGGSAPHPELYMTITLTGVIVASMSTSSDTANASVESGDYGSHSEVIDLVPQVVRWEKFGGAGGGMREWNFVTGTGSG